MLKVIKKSSTEVTMQTLESITQARGKSAKPNPKKGTTNKKPRIQPTNQFR